MENPLHDRGRIPMSIAYREGYKYQLVEPYEVKIPITPDRDATTSLLRLSKDGTLLILDGYAWDGPSGPAVDTTNFMRGSLVHDALYQLIRLGMLDRHWRTQADEVLRDICIEDGMSKARAWWVHTAVKTFAQRAARPSGEPKTLRAP